MKGWCSCSDSDWAIRRPTMSKFPPATKPTRMRTGFAGYACPRAIPAMPASAVEGAAQIRTWGRVGMPFPLRGLNPRVQPWLPERTEKLDLGPAVHDHFQPRRLRQPGRLVVAHAKLRP